MNRHETSAEELLAQLQSDGGFQGRREAFEKERQNAIAAFAEDEKSILLSVNNLGLSIDTVEDLLDLPRSVISRHKSVLSDVLFEHLSSVEHIDDVKMAILRVIGYYRPKKAWPVLFDNYLRNYRVYSAEVRFAIADALSAVMTPANLDELAVIVSCEEYGADRLAFVEKLSRSRSAPAKELLSALVSDQSIGPEVQRLLEAYWRDASE